MIRPIARETAFLLDTGDAVTIARRLRELGTGDLAHVSPGHLDTAASNLRAAAYSLTTAARRFEHLAAVSRATAREGAERPTDTPPDTPQDGPR